MYECVTNFFNGLSEWLEDIKNAAIDAVNEYGGF
jgi:hypothetical protein